MDVKTTCLGVLAKGEASGYEIRKHFEDGPFSHFAEGGFGSIYPALNRLTADGLIDCSQQAQDKRPDKKVYRLNDRGFDALLGALAQPPAEDRYKSDLLFMLFFADHLTPARLALLIDARIDFYRDKLDQMRNCAPTEPDGNATSDSLGPAFVHGFGMSVYQAALNYLETHKARLLDDVARAQNADAAE
jgi:DNA-binding PadR family transcriptional regulator